MKIHSTFESFSCIAFDWRSTCMVLNSKDQSTVCGYGYGAVFVNNKKEEEECI